MPRPLVIRSTANTRRSLMLSIDAMLGISCVLEAAGDRAELRRLGVLSLCARLCRCSAITSTLEDFAHGGHVRFRQTGGFYVVGVERAAHARQGDNALF